MLTGILVSILVTSLHSQWTGLHSTGLPVEPASPLGSSSTIGSGIPTTAAAETASLRQRIQQLSIEIQQAKATSTPNTAITAPLAAPQCPTCPTCDAAAAGATKNVVVSSGSFDQAFDDYIALHKKILARDPSVEHKFIVARPQAQMNNRLRVIVGGIALGMLTKRAFLSQYCVLHLLHDER